MVAVVGGVNRTCTYTRVIYTGLRRVGVNSFYFAMANRGKEERIAKASTKLEKVLDRVRSECRDILTSTIESPTTSHASRRRQAGGSDVGEFTIQRISIIILS